MRNHAMLAGVAIIAIASPAHAETANQARKFDVEAQPAAAGLVAFSRQAGIQIIAPETATRGQRTAAVRGTYSVADGLRRLVARSKLRLVSFDGTTAVVADSSRTAMGGGPIEVASTSPAVYAQDVPPPSVEDDTGLDEIIVTGTRSRGATILTSSSAITVASREDLNRKAPRSTAQALELIPGVFVEGSGGEVSNNYTVRGLAGGGQQFIKIQEDGLPVFYVEALADTILKQEVAVDRLEAVRSGASGILTVNGSGATINFITRKPDYNKSTGTFQLSTSSFGTSRVDAYMTRPIAENTAIALGGFYRRTDGIRDPGYDADHGFIFRAQIAQRFDGGELILSGKVVDDHNIFYVPIPVTGVGDPQSIPGLSATNGTLYGRDFARVPVRVSATSGNSIEEVNLRDGVHTKAWTLGYDLTKDFGDDFTFFAKGRYTSVGNDFNSIFSYDNSALQRVRAGRLGRITLEVTVATGEQPLAPRGGDALLTAAARPDERARNALAFLSYREKYLAGSWRFDTYFGRDTLMSLRLLMPVLQPGAVEDGLGSILTRLAANGEVAHEEDIGEFAVLRNAAEGRGRVATPVYDYAMVDDDFMLAPVARAWLIDRPEGRARAAAFLAGRSGDATRGDLLVRNFAWVVDRSAAFARAPERGNLIALKDGRQTGQWRDSNDGLGLGTIAYDVNAVWVPAALEAIARFADSGLLARHGTAAQRATIARAAAQATAWASAARMFEVTLPNAQARAAIAGYARTAGVPATAALASVGRAPLTFNSLSLDARGRPVPIVHSDDGFGLLFGDPDAAALDRSVTAMMRPFPAGLMTDIGLLVANPAFAPGDLQKRLGRTAYHGTVVWSWQQAVLAAGLDRQIARTDLPPATRNRLVAARAALWRAIDGAQAVRTSELWSWEYRAGGYRVAAFGASAGDADESNAAQLWSTVFLALKAPAAR